MSQGTSVSRVSSGVPWWLWLLLVLVTAGVVGGLIFSSVPEDPQDVFQTAVEAGRSGNIRVLRIGIARLERYPEFQEHRKLLEGIQAVADMRDPKAIEMLEEVKENPELRAYALSSLAHSYRRTGDLAKCIASLRAAVEDDPDAMQPRLELADMYLQLGGLRLAVEEADAVLKSDPENSEALATLGAAYWEMREFRSAADRLGSALKTPGQLSAATPGLVERYLKAVVKLKDLDALSAFGSEHASLIDDDGLRAEILLLQGDGTGLQGMIDKMKEFGGEAPGVTKLKAQQALQNGDGEKAFQLLSGLTAIVPRDMEIWKMLRDAAIKLDRPQTAEIAQQNIDGLNEIEDEYRKVAAEQTDQVDQVDPLVKLGDLAMSIGEYELVYLWYQRASVIDPSLAHEAMEKRRAMYTIQKALVPLPLTDADDEPAADDAGTEKAPPTDPAADDAEQPADKQPNDAEQPADKQPNDAAPPADAANDPASEGDNPVDESAVEPGNAEGIGEAAKEEVPQDAAPNEPAPSADDE